MLFRSTHLLILSHDDHTITVQFQHTLENDGRDLSIDAEVKMLRRAVDSTGQIEIDDGLALYGGSMPWSPSLTAWKMMFTLPTKCLAVALGFTWAAPSHYFLGVEIVEEYPEEMTTGSSKRNSGVGHLGSTAKQVGGMSNSSGGKQS